MDKRALTLIDMERMALAAEAYRSAIRDIAAETGLHLSVRVSPHSADDARSGVSAPSILSDIDPAEQLANLGGTVKLGNYGSAVDVNVGTIYAYASHRRETSARFEALAARAVKS